MHNSQIVKKIRGDSLAASLFCAVAAMAFVASAADPRVPPLFTGSVMTNETVLFMGTDDLEISL